MGIEQRRHPRYGVHLAVRYANAEQFVADYVENLSAGGLFIAGANQLALNTETDIHIELPGQGDWTVRAYRNKATGTEQIALVKGRVDPAKPTLVRMHALSPFADMFGEDSDRSRLLSRSMELIAEEGAGVIIVINRHRADAFTTAVKMKVGEPVEVEMEELRDYGVGAMILAELGVHDMVLLTNTHHTLVGLDGYGLSIVGERKID